MIQLRICTRSSSLGFLLGWWVESPVLSRGALLCARRSSASPRRALHAPGPRLATSSRFSVSLFPFHRELRVCRISESAYNWHLTAFLSLSDLWKLLSACPPRPVCCVCHSWFIVLSTALVPFHRLLFWSPVCPQTWCGTACVLGLPSPHRGHISSSGWAPSTSIWWPAARPPQARPCPLPLPPGRWSFICRGGCCPTRLSSRTRGLLGAATSSLSLQRQGNAKAWRFTLSGLWKPSPPCRRRHLGSSFHCCWVVAGSLLACLPLCSGSTRLPKLPPEWCF